MYPLTPHQIREALHRLGLQPGQVVMMHGSVKAVGPVLGGPNTILQAVLDTLTPTGTLMMYAGWEDTPDDLDDLPDAERQHWIEHFPPFDPATARAVRDNSILAEFLRTWPGAHRSLNPEASMVAVGAHAAALTRDHTLNYGYGVGSPLERLVQANGSVLLLGAPLDTITLLHYAEAIAQMRHKEVVHYRVPLLRDGQRVWVEVEDFDTGDPHDDYEFEQIAQAYLDSGQGRKGTVGQAPAYLFDAAGLVAFAVEWLETHFGKE
ncbi:aminoglycoside 3-N-acetyltransferase [Fischerella thermalis CCMEE 5330]|uniref:Aminoglycoside N(3)-acetyltransferase n=1 Tax=Fischerella thermalis CCMEE 5330 TaxID=2019670 RepID=A0A2N6MNR9_9CYAN|nr:aminoglycoside 3-N-acetyltransferase [Fischerella thermalis CCMEE 5330]